MATFKITPHGSNSPAAFTVEAETHESAATSAAIQMLGKARGLVALRVTGEHGKNGMFQGYVNRFGGGSGAAQNSTGWQFHVSAI